MGFILKVISNGVKVYDRYHFTENNLLSLTSVNLLKLCALQFLLQTVGLRQGARRRWQI